MTLVSIYNLVFFLQGILIRSDFEFSKRLFFTENNLKKQILFQHENKSPKFPYFNTLKRQLILKPADPRHEYNRTNNLKPTVYCVCTCTAESRSLQCAAP